MNKVHVTTAWNGDGLSLRTAYRPAAADDCAVHSYRDVTGNDPRQGGAFTVEIVCDDATLTALTNNPKYQGKTTLVATQVNPHGS